MIKCAWRKVNNENLSIYRSSAWCCLVRCFSWSTDGCKIRFKKTVNTFLQVLYFICHKWKNGTQENFRDFNSNAYWMFLYAVSSFVSIFVRACNLYSFTLCLWVIFLKCSLRFDLLLLRFLTIMIILKIVLNFIDLFKIKRTYFAKLNCQKVLLIRVIKGIYTFE